MLGYALFPLIACALAKVSRGAVALTVVVISLGSLMPVGLALHQFGQNALDGPDCFWRMAGEFAAGAALYCARTSAGTRAARLSPVIGTVAVAAICVFTLMQSIVLVPFYMAGLLWAASFRADGPLSRVLTSRAALLVGRLSFPLHPAARDDAALGDPGARAVGGGRSVDLCRAAGGRHRRVLGSAWALHRWVEQPCARRARRIGTVVTPDATTAALPSRAAAV